MEYRIEFLPEAADALQQMSPEVARRVTRKIDRLRNDLAGDVKRLKNFTPDYRLRVGDWRVLFEVKQGTIFVHQVLHRSKAYD